MTVNDMDIIFQPYANDLGITSRDAARRLTFQHSETVIMSPRSWFLTILMQDDQTVISGHRSDPRRNLWLCCPQKVGSA
jgi:hypothetical protein